jgi:hypothetical protein
MTFPQNQGSPVRANVLSAQGIPNTLGRGTSPEPVGPMRLPARALIGAAVTAGAILAIVAVRLG